MSLPQLLRLPTCISALLLLAAASEAQPCPTAATAVSVQGRVAWQRPPDTAWRPLGRDQALCAGDVVRAAPASRADLALANRSMLRLREDTQITLEGANDEGTTVVDMLRGAAHFLSQSGTRNVEIQTPYTVAGVRGTEFNIAVEDGRAQLLVFEGRVAMSNPSGSLLVGGAEAAVAEAGRAPTRVLVANPRDAVQWTLYYLPVLHAQPSSFSGTSAWEQRAREALEAYRRGDLGTALATLDAIPEDGAPPRLDVLRASLRLRTGGVDAARADLSRALARAPGDAEALALQATIAVSQNRVDEAAALAAQAVAADAGSAPAWIAKSYVAQARFDLEEARHDLEQAVAAEPEDALAWARLAELEASFGRLDRTLEAAERASALDPDLSRTRTVLGFAQLLRGRIDQARQSFERAIALDDADPLPRLGLGLARIRKGALDAGTREIEVAASLDPANALVRSYLGKAYYEEKQTPAALDQWDVARELDPNDPTPWFYSAIAKQTTNRPVEALQDMQEATRLNDDRAVYRSRLMLDSDQAARGAGLGRIFTDLGFEQLALVQGWRSIEWDPTNDAAHRLLSDTYAALPRHEIARVSELLQSQLLQPLNLVPLQPRQATPNLFLLASQGPTGVSFNEFNPLFQRNRLAGQASGLGGEDETWRGVGIVSGVYDQLAVSAGYDRFSTDGFRSNNEQDDGIGSAFVQYEITPDTSVQAEFRRRNLDAGDLEVRFFAEDFSRYLDEETDTTSVRGGMRHRFSPNSTLLTSYIFQDAQTNFDDFIPDPFFGDFSTNLDLDETAHSGEAQYLYRSDPIGEVLRNVNAVAGVGHAAVDVNERVITVFDSPFFPEPDVTDERRHPDVDHTNAYVYSTSTFALAGRAALTLGVSGDFFHEDEGIGRSNQANPKLGITWSPDALPGVTLRAAGFRTLKRTLVTDQTLEPTQVAGFNQFFDDPSGTDAWRWGTAVDWQACDWVFFGGEYSERYLDVPQGIFGDGSSITATLDWEEWWARAYVFLTPHPWVSLRAEYRYEEFKRDPFEYDDGFGGTARLYFAFAKVKTHWVPLGVDFFHPSGVGASFGATFLDQHGNFYRDDIADTDHGTRSFWILDAALKYRLPKRYGFVSVGVNNFLDVDRTYQATDVRNPEIRPGRFVYGSVTLALP